MKQNESSPNPYLAGREEWDNRYFKMAKAIRGWQLAFAIASGIALVLAINQYRFTAKTDIQPFVVETCKGEPVALLPTVAKSPHKDAILHFVASQFILNTRTMVADPDAQSAILHKAYAYSADKTLQFLHDYYDKNDPFKAAAHTTVQVNIVHTVPISPLIWQVTWDETQKDVASGATLTTKRFMANLNLTWGQVNPAFAQENPFGLYISTVSWSEIPTR